MIDLDHLLKTASATDPRVSEALVGEYYAYIHRLALSILGDPDEAEDAAQETFITALSNLHRYQTGTSLKNWLSTIAVNRCRDGLRRRRTRQALQGVLQAIDRVTRPQSHPEETTLTNERTDTLWKAVNNLDEKHRLPVLMRFVHGLPVREIAQILEVSEGTIHSRLHYAIQKLQSQLKDLNGYPFSHDPDGGVL